MTFQIHPSFAPLLDRYDGFILDQFGVMHNGSHGLEDAVAAMKQKGKKIIILSNSSSSSEATVAKLPKLGFKIPTSENIVNIMLKFNDAILT